MLQPRNTESPVCLLHVFPMYLHAHQKSLTRGAPQRGVGVISCLASLANPIVPENHQRKHSYNKEVGGELMVKKLS